MSVYATYAVRPVNGFLAGFTSADFPGAACRQIFLIAGSVNRLPAQQDIPSEFENTIPELMSDQNVPGLAIAVVDERGVLWCGEFGVTDYVSKQPVTADTIFSIQSMSKTFTATAVLIAAQGGSSTWTRR